ncbi:hypothetical protein HELRODRAFT_167753 [Helobdella robusta]|uniref:CUB domain-containing protein n=1 Tax=Helobdella robusta TaxID=6412 RepID=T1EZR5_HELRO|nr:hypothetical protein HELRODRAFT_167753 [Helobdella robusta]ESO09928.1 hypothetical protein HELRODRAFT_167753 [Helobdella robusta]
MSNFFPNFGNTEAYFQSEYCSSSPDRLVARDGSDATSPIINIYCGILNSQTITSSSTHLYLELITDELNHKQGFAALYNFVPQMSVDVRTDDVGLSKNVINHGSFMNANANVHITESFRKPHDSDDNHYHHLRDNNNNSSSSSNNNNNLLHDNKQQSYVNRNNRHSLELQQQQQNLKHDFSISTSPAKKLASWQNLNNSSLNCHHVLHAAASTWPQKYSHNQEISINI